jgi:hypothetical protein
MDLLIYFTPIALLLLAKYYSPVRITFFEVGLGTVVISLSAHFIFTYAILNKVLDKEILNGQVIEKIKTRVNCDHSYECNCRRSDNSPAETCYTCYEHNYDINWKLESTIGDIKIPRVDRQGTVRPPAWLKAYESEPVSRVNVYENYIQGAKSSLLNESDFAVETRFKHLIPQYPLKIYDHYRFDHALSVNFNVNNLAEWNELLAESLKEIGPSKQVNVILLIANIQDPNYARSLKKAWQGGNQHDVIIVAGSTNYPVIEWVDVISWSPSELFKVQLRDAILSSKKLNPKNIVPIIQQHIQDLYEPFQMSQHAHLKNEIDLSKDNLYVILSILVIGSFTFVLLAYKYQISVLFFKLGGIATLIGFMYLITLINFFVIFFGAIFGIIGFMLWLNFREKLMTKLKANPTVKKLHTLLTNAINSLVKIIHNN